VGRASWALHAQSCRPSVENSAKILGSGKRIVEGKEIFTKKPREGAQSMEESQWRKPAEGGWKPVGRGRGGAEGSKEYRSKVNKDTDECTRSTTVCTLQTAVQVSTVCCYYILDHKNSPFFRTSQYSIMAEKIVTDCEQEGLPVSFGILCRHGG
jgi:hypothetical protein